MKKLFISLLLIIVSFAYTINAQNGNLIRISDMIEQQGFYNQSSCVYTNENGVEQTLYFNGLYHEIRIYPGSSITFHVVVQIPGAERLYAGIRTYPYNFECPCNNRPNSIVNWRGEDELVITSTVTVPYKTRFNCDGTSTEQIILNDGAHIEVWVSSAPLDYSGGCNEIPPIR